jgi:membrane fusion protein
VDLSAQHGVAYGETAPPKSGMTLDAAVILDRRRVIEWLFEPLIGAALRHA